MREDSTRYALLPFRFKRLDVSTELLVNEFGDYVFAEPGTASAVARKQLTPDDPVFRDLVSKFFISDTPLDKQLHILASRMRTKRAHLKDFTSLHIFVPTLRCNSDCTYCQVSRKGERTTEFDMSDDTLSRAIDFMFCSPSQNLTVEFQGGDPSLRIDIVRKAISQINERNASEGRNIQFVICTNLVAATQELIDLCAECNMKISTSLDGPAHVHNHNRPHARRDNYERVIENIRRCQEGLGVDSVSPLVTISEYSLDYPAEIINEYQRLGFRSIFLRALNPYGFARGVIDDDAYLLRYLDFYKRALIHILDMNLAGTPMVEEYAAILATKILTPFGTNFTDLQSPSGIINSVLVYNYDGKLYASDESRMLAEQGDSTFCLGEIDAKHYHELLRSEKVEALTEYWNNESLPGCSECAYMCYCGADPVREYTTYGNPGGIRAHSSVCKKNMGIIDFLFHLIRTNRLYERVLRSWTI